MTATTATRTKKTYNKEAQQQRQVNYMELLEHATTDIGKLKEGYTAFHNFSMMNRLLATMQLNMLGKPVTPIKTFNQWNALNRRVNKGEHALELCMPYVKKYTTKNKETGEDEVKGYTKFTFKKYWFSMSQTSGEDYTPEAITWNKEKALAELKLELIPFECIDGNVQGYAVIEDNKISINPLNKHYYSTLFHEIAHKLLHPVNTNLSSSVKEVEAESVAMLVVATLELDDISYNRGYIQNWISGGKITEKMAQRIISTADKILKAGTVENN